ncbi:MAG: response regulator [Verrucomicrobiota bacterium]
MKNLNDKSILVIDDDPGMLRALDKVLRSKGATVTCANWAGDAVEILTSRKKQFDLVITDLRMPFVNGMTVIYAIHEIFPALPVIVLTAFANPEVRAACREQGAVAFLEKPLESQELITAVRRVLRLETSDFDDKPEQRKESGRSNYNRTTGASTGSSPERKNKEANKRVAANRRLENTQEKLL